MKAANRAPAFACLYHGLAGIARTHGYALTIHGTMINDFDLVAIPWIDDAGDPETLVEALRQHLNACLDIDATPTVENKPHNRRAWNLYLDFGAKVDLSVMPRATTVAAELTEGEQKCL